jgi:hypothetical protein
MRDVKVYRDDLFTDDAMRRPYERYRDSREQGPVWDFGAS